MENPQHVDELLSMVANMGPKGAKYTLELIERLGYQKMPQEVMAQLMLKAAEEEP